MKFPAKTQSGKGTAKVCKNLRRRSGLEAVGAVSMAAEHFDGDGDGVELIVMLCIGERTNLLEKSVDPGAADKRHLSLLGKVRPAESASEFVGVDANSTKATTKETVFAAKLLKKRLTMKSLFDAVF